MSRAKAPIGGTRGFIVPIGGDGRLIRNAAILRRFIEICGGSRAHIGIISTGSATKDAGRRYERAFRDLGGDRVSALKFETRTDCEAKRNLDVLDSVDGLFLTGSDPVHLSETLGSTSMAQKIRIRNAQGMHVAGTSAGAAFLPGQMIAAGESGTTPRADIVQLAPGLGLIERLIIDQHFRHQDRLGRLLMALTYNPLAIGIGLDEDTAAFIGPDHRLQVLGSGGITIVDPSQLQHSAIHPDRRHAPVSVVGLHLDILVEGSLYDLTAHMASIRR
ncbi:cyanophycinase [Paraburkholderia sp. BL10I2N1]|uniref:cyanophycinase n=1 Tax=Paraburkholderia sp. BL10I2N1 TaxID=1938796 RepID=UPI00105F4263|nr:cyanophycinase [Paraburkholderia sp. BL10I2N1]TDN67348.1 cyanophycinase [Paraburkholderia sp. BL10I2N1]